ncbi:hypothetical protein A0J61_09058 [Choanephora cucurbitarum]|uniref:Uncharacterized protein n=1 Tax=Choanephora cucurbitarum TaxID=101091 RepID=A0A1C7N6E0_9FUNG|nr:hypothetical protein A0J61_09058 [Choanephora cucurbitarum]
MLTVTTAAILTPEQYRTANVIFTGTAYFVGGLILVFLKFCIKVLLPHSETFSIFYPDHGFYTNPLLIMSSSSVSD